VNASLKIEYLSVFSVKPFTAGDSAHLYRAPPMRRC